MLGAEGGLGKMRRLEYRGSHAAVAGVVSTDATGSGDDDKAGNLSWAKGYVAALKTEGAVDFIQGSPHAKGYVALGRIGLESAGLGQRGEGEQNEHGEKAGASHRLIVS